MAIVMKADFNNMLVWSVEGDVLSLIRETVYASQGGRFGNAIVRPYSVTLRWREFVRGVSGDSVRRGGGVFLGGMAW